MEQIFLSREFLFEMDRRDFELDHGANIKEVQVARALVEGNIQIVNHFIDNGLFTRKRFEEILRDEELQGEYSQMAEALIRGIDDAFDLLYNDINKISHILKNTEVLPIRTDTSEIYVGNRVVVKFEDEDTEELFKVGTTTDASYPMNKFRWVSIESPLGRELLGKKKGDSVIYKINFVDKNVDILDVLSEE